MLIKTQCSFSHLERVEEVRPELDQGDVLVQPAAAGPGQVGDAAAADSPVQSQSNIGYLG